MMSLMYNDTEAAVPGTEWNYEGMQTPEYQDSSRLVSTSVDIPLFLVG